MKIIIRFIILIAVCVGNNAFSQDILKNENSRKKIETPNKGIESVLFKPLYELFTSSTCGPCVGANEILDEIFENNPGEYSSIKYQMDWPGNGDPYFTQEGGVRRNYYGVYSVPNLYINAEELYPAQSFTQEIFDEYAALTTSMEIEITEAFIDEDNVISVEVEISSLASYDAGLTAHIVVVEKKTFNNVGSNGETVFHDVMMKMLPDAQGTELDELPEGSLVTLAESYDMDETFMETPNDLAVIVFVQDDSDKSVIQSETANVNGEFEVYNITYEVVTAFGYPKDNVEVVLENNGSLYTNENGQVLFEEILIGNYEYSVNYPGLIPHTGSINLIDEDIVEFITLDHYTSLQETFNAGFPESWTKHVAEGNYLFHFLGKMKFSRFNANDDLVLLLSPAIEINSTDTLTFEYGEVLNEPILSFGVISDPFDPETFTEIEILYPQNEWESYELALNSLTSADTVIYFAWRLASETETSFHLDNVFIQKEGEMCMPVYNYGCDYFGMGFTDFILEQIDNSNSNCSDLNGVGWSQYLELGPAELLAGETYTITMSSGYENTNASVWIDLNDDFEFTQDEKVIENFLMENPSILYEVEFTIPANAADGLHLLRARSNGEGFCNDPCEEYNYGEAEDYLVQIGEEIILPPTNLTFETLEGNVILEWEAPITDELVGYNVYHSHEMGNFELMATVEENTFTHETPEYGLHQYYATAEYDAGESDPTNTVEVLITGLLSQIENGFTIYPNPATDIVNINAGIEIRLFKIFNHSGQLIEEKTIRTKSYQFDISQIVPGLYFFQVETNKGMFNKRIVIQ